MERRKFEYKFLELTPKLDDNIQALNLLGADGWYIVSVSQGALHDDVGYSSILLVRERE